MKSFLVVVSLIAFSLSFGQSAKTYLKVAEIKFNNADYEGTVEECNKGILKDDSKYQFYLLRAISKVQLKQYTESLPDFDKVFNFNSNYPQANYYRGIAYYYLQDYEKAVSDIDIAIASKYNTDLAYLVRSEINLENKQLENALSDANQALALNPQNSKFLTYRAEIKAKSNDFKGATEDLNAAMTINPHEIHSYFVRGLLKVQEKDFQAAVNYFTTTMQLEPNNADSYHNRGVSKLNLNEFEDALVDFEKYISLRPKNSVGYYLKACALSDLKKYDEAIPFYNLAIQKEPKKYHYHLDRANTYYEKSIALSDPDAEEIEVQMPEFEKNANLAVADLTIVKALAPDSSYAYYLSALIQSRVFEMKQALFEESYDEETSDEEVFIDQSIESLDLCLKEINSAIAKDSTKANYYDVKANIYLSLGEIYSDLQEVTENETKISEAEKQEKLCKKEVGANFKLAALKDPKELKFVFQKAEFEKEEQQYAAAILDFSTCISLDPGFSYAYYHRALSYVKLKQFNKACPDFEKAYALGESIAKDFLAKYCGKKE